MDIRRAQAFARLLNLNHLKLVGHPLPSDDPEWLYEEAPFGLLAHDAAPDPVFTYANKTAQACFEYSWDEFVTLPSRLSALPGNREDRQHLLDTVSENGFISGYHGIRVAKSGRLFRVEALTLWNLLNEDGQYVGQSAMFPRWSSLS
ncbi:MEKHLA domain-containing protein [Kibdelosporangium philippinense]|uniref:MEKHLA domain-containing protein n=1 Tax=Kibdelosporangium philippinense TaxID=211113 RepID=A0ABS8ZTS5_9PSEU|nr:MEKHLA domain-containing protein [Kibdelosporangium philippinense]MCE7011087.1 MEKHLA domain-containing protein [Kibdelosporangium philippinense]